MMTSNSEQKPILILFVCLGNICRSPAAEGLLKRLSQNNPFIHIESCGLGNWHIGQLPDGRMQKAAQVRGLALSSRAQQFQPHFFDQFDFIFAADNEVLHELQRTAPKLEHKAKIHLMTVYSSAYKGEEIPDPYYYGDAGFELVLDMLEDSCEGIFNHIKKEEQI